MVIPNEGKPFWLDRAVQSPAFLSSNTVVRLFVNDITPDDDTVFASFTPASFTGSDPITLGNANWSGAAVAADVAESTYTPAPDWTNTGVTTETAYGWFLSIETADVCVAAQRFDTPRVMSPGAEEVLDPFTFKLKTFA